MSNMTPQGISIGTITPASIIFEIILFALSSLPRCWIFRHGWQHFFVGLCLLQCLLLLMHYGIASFTYSFLDMGLCGVMYSAWFLHSSL